MLNIGDRVVYPMHGAGTVKDIIEREDNGEKKQFFVNNCRVREKLSTGCPQYVDIFYNRIFYCFSRSFAIMVTGGFLICK